MDQSLIFSIGKIKTTQQNIKNKLDSCLSLNDMNKIKSNLSLARSLNNQASGETYVLSNIYFKRMSNRSSNISVLQNDHRTLEGKINSAMNTNDIDEIKKRIREAVSFLQALISKTGSFRIDEGLIGPFKIKSRIF